ncbi:MAG: phosphatidate cytidylyltransferase [Oxalobacteraceae bacterium]
MLRQRVLTAVALLTLLAVVLGSQSMIAFRLTLAVFFAAACWESCRLLKLRWVIPLSVSGGILLLLMLFSPERDWTSLALLCVLIWALRFAPALKFGLPSEEGVRGLLFATVFFIALLGCFISMAELLQRSTMLLVSAMAVVWVADIGAYVAGRAFGRRKLAPSISPGKSWEGVLGGWLAVLLLGAASTFSPWLEHSFATVLQQRFGWGLWLLLMSLLVAASVIGDLFESLMKRRAGVKDSSHLLPGHGGVLDRIDALLPVMPLTLLLAGRA